ncbi:unnamed protein product [Clonostachys solani]|uniref:Zn(2)-C6 fungal-type domain-containing protein n=1 Tax=Clonostachys solani TaxID=160281 RepID=A0A9N9Z9N7_9HYPO|nr:unnamed protein product [Clonostachys solani]
MAASALGKRARTDDDSNPNPDTRRRAVRKRAALACDECRVRKRRCDGGFPTCGGCTHRRSACVYSSEVEARAWQSSTLQSLRSRLEELEAAETASNVGLGASSPHRDSHMPARTQLPEGEDEGIVQSEEAVPPTQQQTAMAPSILAEPRSFEKLMKPILQAVEQPSKGPSNPTPSSLKDHNTAQCTCDFLLGATEWSLPLRRVADQLVDTYFARVQRIYPILHQPTFRRRYNLLWQSGSGGVTRTCLGLCKTKNECKLFAAMLQAVFGLAALLGAGSPEDNAVQADAFFSRAQKLNFLDTLDDDVGLELVQLGLIMGFYLQGTDTFSKCWNITGLTIRLAQNMGLHLDLEEARLKGLVPSQVTQLEQEMRSRVWYGCVVLEREVSMSFGRKLTALPIATNPRLPNLVDDDLLSDQPGKWNTQTDGLPSLVESFVYTAKLYDIFYRLLDRPELQEPISPDKGYEVPEGGLSSIRALLELDHAVMEWREGLPSYLRYEPELTERNTTDSLSTLNRSSPPHPDLTIQAQRLYLRFLNIRILILRPALDQLFEKQRRNQTEPGKRRHRRLGDAILRDAAIQCVQCAQELAIFLDAQVRSKNLIAWWYNVTCRSQTSGYCGEAMLTLGQTFRVARARFSSAWPAASETVVCWKSHSQALWTCVFRGSPDIQG